MAASWAQLPPNEHRTEPRDEVNHRARATDLAAGCPLPMLVVNLSPSGMMARCEVPLAPGDRLRVALPGAGTRVAAVRWALGGRIGCAFEEPIGLAEYVTALAAMR